MAYNNYTTRYRNRNNYNEKYGSYYNRRRHPYRQTYHYQPLDHGLSKRSNNRKAQRAKRKTKYVSEETKCGPDGIKAGTMASTYITLPINVVYRTLIKFLTH